mgnify:CR=1 FL=1
MPRQMATLEFAQPAVKAAMEPLVALMVDLDEHGELVKRYKVPGPPTVVFTDSRGNKREDLSFSGPIGPEEFLEKL